MIDFGFQAETQALRLSRSGSGSKFAGFQVQESRRQKARDADPRALYRDPGCPTSTALVKSAEV